jgi:hypothetical protein
LKWSDSNHRPKIDIESASEINQTINDYTSSGAIFKFLDITCTMTTGFEAFIEKRKL